MNAHGVWKLSNGRFYLFPKGKLDVSCKQTKFILPIFETFSKWGSAYKKCCSLGMKMLSLEMDHKYASLIKAFTSTYNNETYKFICKIFIQTT
jgi:hypothetical protein